MISELAVRILSHQIRICLASFTCSSASALPSESHNRQREGMTDSMMSQSGCSVCRTDCPTTSSILWPTVDVCTSSSAGASLPSSRSLSVQLISWNLHFLGQIQKPLRIWSSHHCRSAFLHPSLGGLAVSIVHFASVTHECPLSFRIISLSRSYQIALDGNPGPFKKPQNHPDLPTHDKHTESLPRLPRVQVGKSTQFQTQSAFQVQLGRMAVVSPSVRPNCTSWPAEMCGHRNHRMRIGTLCRSCQFLPSIFLAITFAVLWATKFCPTLGLAHIFS